MTKTNFEFRSHRELRRTPQYRKHVLVGELAQYKKEVLQQIADGYGFSADTMEVREDHVHVFVEVPPKYSPAEVVRTVKSILARHLLVKFRKLPKQFWAGELWSDGNFVRNVGRQSDLRYD